MSDNELKMNKLSQDASQYLATDRSKNMGVNRSMALTRSDTGSSLLGKKGVSRMS